MLGMITCTGNRARLYRDEHTDFPLRHPGTAQARAERESAPGRLSAAGGYPGDRHTSELMKLIAPALERTGMELVKTSSMLRRLCPYLAVAAARDLRALPKGFGRGDLCGKRRDRRAKRRGRSRWKSALSVHPRPGRGPAAASGGPGTGDFCIGCADPRRVVHGQAPSVF